MDEIVERTDGVPLFVEELTKAVLESGAQEAPALSAMRVKVRWCLGPYMPRCWRGWIGWTVAKDVAQAGAAIGREFRFEVLASIIDVPEPQLRDSL